MDRGTVIILGITFVVAVGLIIAGSYVTKGGMSGVAMWKDTDVECLNNGHENLSQHIHPTLTIFVDGQPETIPATIGNDATCMAEVHTHDEDGMIHVETVEADKIFTLADFFTVWGKSIEREGYTLTTMVDGVVTEATSVLLSDGQKIEMQYNSGNKPSPSVERPAGLPKGAVMEIQ